MRDILEQLLRATDVLTPERAQLRWDEYRTGADSPDPAVKRRADAAFATLLACYGGTIYRHVWGFVRCDAAEDIFQDVLKSWHEARLNPRLADVANVLPWLRKVAANKCRDALRRTSRRHRREARSARPEGEPPADNPEELQEAIRVALSQLSEDQRQAVALYYFEGLDKQDAAAVLGINRDTLSKRLDDALARLRKLLPGLAVGGTLAVPAALTAHPPALSAARLSELASAAWAKAAAPAWSLAKVAAVVLVGLALGGAATAAVLAMTRQKEPAAATPLSTQRADPETLQAKYLRVFNAEVKPKVLAALQKLTLGEYGTAEITETRTFDTRIECHAILRHGEPFNFASQWRITYDTAPSEIRFRLDFRGNGQWRGLDRNQPMYWNNPLTGKRTVVRFPELDQIVTAFVSASWDDPRLRDEAAARLEALDRAAEDFEGVWYELGDATRPIHVRFDPNDPSPLQYTFPDGGKALVPLIDLKVGPDGRLRGASHYHTDGMLSPDGRRVDFPGTGQWWTREPIRQGS